MINLSYIDRTVKLEQKAIVEPFCIIQSDTVIGKKAHIRSHTVIYERNVIGDNFSTGNKVNIRNDNKIGDNVSIGTLTNIEYDVIIEDNVRIHSQCFIPEFTVLKNGCWIGPNVVFTNSKYPNRPGSKEKRQGCIVEEGAVIGANTTILPGVKIGKNSIIGAGSVVTENVLPDRIYYGNPAKPMGSVSTKEDYI